MRIVSLLLSVLFLGCAGQTNHRRHIRIVRRPPPPVIKKGPPPLTVSVKLDNPYVRAAHTVERIARVRIRAARELGTRRAPVNLSLVVDTSGSMAGQAIAHARAAARAMLGQLKDGDRISLVVFHSASQVLLRSTVVSSESRPLIAASIDKMVARGTTDLAGGLSHGIGQVRAYRRSGSINRVVLLSDGIPNDPRRVLPLARMAQRYGITITALGLGLDYDETLLGSIAQATGGSFHYVKDPARVATVFRREVVRMSQVIAQNLMLRILPGPGVTVVRVYGRALQRSGRYVWTPLGVLRSGEHRDVMVRLRVPGRRAGATVELADGLVTYYAKTGRRNFGYQHKLFVSAKSTADPAKLAATPNKDFALSLARAEAAQATLDAIALARQRKLKAALALLDRALAAARAAAAKYRDKHLVVQVKQMVKLRTALPTLVPRAVRTHFRHRRRRWRRPGLPVRGPRPVAPTPQSADTIRKAHSAATKVLSR